MKFLIFIMLFSIIIIGCQFSIDDKPLSKRQLEKQKRQEKIRILQENKEKAIKEAEIFNSNLQSRPKLKNFTLDTRRPDIYSPFGHKITSTSVANLPGKIEIEFGRDATIKIIRFEHRAFLKDKIMEITEFADLIGEFYDFTWSPIMDEENPSYVEYNYVQDSTSFFLSGEGKGASYIDERDERQVKELRKK